MEIKEIKAGLTLAEVIRYYGYKADKYNRINCPFHPDKTPSLQLYWKTQSCYCFSTNCPTNGKSLDVIDFIMHKENCSKHDAILKAKELITGTTSPAQELTRTAILTKMFTYFKNAVHNSTPAREYITGRGLDYTKLEIGYNTGQFHHGTRKDEALIKSCLKVGLLMDKGLKSRTGGKAYVPFGKNCICFALRNPAGQVSGLYFRSTTNNKHQRHFYLKDRQGLYPKYPKPETKRLVLTESIIDAASLLQTDQKEYEVLALYGTNGLTKEHMEAVKQLNELEEIIFFLNGDEPGRKAVQKHSETLRQLKPGVKITEVQPPEGEDVNSLLHSHEPGVIMHLIEKRSSLSFSHESPSNEDVKPEPSSAPEPLKAETPGLNTTNPEYITYRKDDLKFTLLGGISLGQVDRLRVTLKLNIEPQLSPLQSIRHNIDLYNDDQVEKFCRKAAGKLEIGTSQILTALSELIEALEKYRLSKLESQKDTRPKKRILGAEQRKAALDYLKAPDLLKRTNQDIAKTGVIGEEINRLLMYLVFTSRLREQPLHTISLGASGSGKTYLQEKVAELIPEEDVIEVTILSDNAFYYFDRQELQNKLILIEDMDGAENVLYPLRELMSKKRISKRVVIKDSKGNMRTINLQVEGPICVAGTTTRERVYEDNANRSLLLYLDGSKKHQEQIMDYQRALSAGEINAQAESQIKEQFKDMQSLLKPVKVRNPYAKELKIPQEVFKPLRSNSHYLQFIECITFYHQYQRPLKTGPGGESYIETTLEDIAAANALLKDVLLAKADELSGACRKFFEALKVYLQKEDKQSFYANEIRASLRITPTTLKRYLYQLLASDYIKIVGGNKHRRGYEYEIVSYEEYQALQNNIRTALDEALDKIKNKQ